MIAVDRIGSIQVKRILDGVQTFAAQTSIVVFRNKSTLSSIQWDARAMTIHNGFVQARKTSPATRTYFLHRNKYNEPSDLSWGQNNSTSEKMIKCFVTFTPNPRGEKMVHELAGLLTDSRPDAFPTERSVAMQMVSGRWLELHSSGTVRDLHPIPFYCLFVNAKWQTNSAIKIGNYLSFLQTFLWLFAWFVLQYFGF